MRPANPLLLRTGRQRRAKSTVIGARRRNNTLTGQGNDKGANDSEKGYSHS